MAFTDAVWYIQAGTFDGTTFHAERQFSGVLVMVRSVDESQARILLLTVQHGIRTDVDPDRNHYAGPYWDAYRGWRPGSRLTAPEDAIPLKLYAPLTPDSSLALSDSTDVAFLAFAGEADNAWSGANPDFSETWMIEQADVSIAGYAGGSEISEFLGNTVSPNEYREWRYRALLEQRQTGVLTDGNSALGRGASGGAVHHDGRLVGIYRGSFAGQQLFMPIQHIQRRCESATVAHRLIEFSSDEPAENSVLTSLKRYGWWAGAVMVGACASLLPEWWIHASHLWLILAVAAMVISTAGWFLKPILRKRPQLGRVLFHSLPLALGVAALCIWIVAGFSGKVVVELTSRVDQPVRLIRYAIHPPEQEGRLETLPYDGPLLFQGNKVMMIMDGKQFGSIVAFKKQFADSTEGRCFRDTMEEIQRHSTYRPSLTYREHE